MPHKKKKNRDSVGVSLAALGSGHSAAGMGAIHQKLARKKVGDTEKHAKH